MVLKRKGKEIEEVNEYKYLGYVMIVNGVRKHIWRKELAREQ